VGCGLTLALFVAVAAHAALRSFGFTIRDSTLGAVKGKLVYEVTICTRRKSKLTLIGTFMPQSPKLPRITVGAYQYQSSGCWPAFVTAKLATSADKCAPTGCAAVKGRRYLARITITGRGPKQTRRAPLRRATA